MNIGLSRQFPSGVVHQLGDFSFNIKQGGTVVANGDYLSPEELRQYIKPIELIKKQVDEFASLNGLEIYYYSRGWPHVTLRWKNSFDLNCLVQLCMNDDKVTYMLRLAATKHIANDRYMKELELHTCLKPPFDANFIIGEMKKGFDLCNSWKFEKQRKNKK
jgi:hypothetical protein